MAVETCGAVFYAEASSFPGPNYGMSLRWYAHNRGYDGNRRWSTNDVEALKEDTEKEENARSLLTEFKSKHGRDGTMAEIFCDKLDVDPLGPKRSSTFRFKGLNAAFPRAVVEDEVRRILRAHFKKLDKVDIDLERTLLGRDSNDKLAWQTISCPGSEAAQALSRRFTFRSARSAIR